MLKPIKPIFTLLYVLSSLYILVGVCGCSGKRPEYVNPEREKSVREVTNIALNSKQTNSEGARQTLEHLSTQDSGNALTAYLRAAAAAKEKDWNGVQQALEEGNAAPKCIEYQKAETAFYVYPGLARIRTLARECCQAAPSLGPDKGGKLLTAVHQMGTRLTHLEPLGTTCALGGGGIRRMTDRAQVTLYEKRGKKTAAEQARKRYAADKAWFERTRAIVDTESPLDFSLKSAAMAEKHGITQAELASFGEDGPLSADSMKKFASFLKEINTTERAIAEKVLKTLPN